MYPLSNGNFTDSYSTLRGHIWQTKFWQIYPPHQWQFYRFLLYSESSYLAEQVLADLTPHINGNFTDSCSTLRDHIWQTKCWQIYPLSNGNFTDCCSDSSYFIPTLRAHHLADQVLTGLPPIQWWFYRFLFWQLTILRAYHLADQVKADLTCPPSYGNFTDSCEIHISFLLWELIIWQTRSWQIYPRSNGNFTDSCSDSSHFMTAHISFLLRDLNIWQTRSWQMYPHLSGNFIDSYSDNSYFILTLRAYHFADEVLTDLPPIQWWFYRFLLWQLTSLRAQHLADQVLADLTPTSDGNFTDSFEIHISFLLWELNIWLTRSWQIYPPPSNGNFTDSCSTLKAHIC